MPDQKVENAPRVTSVRTHVYVTFANPNLVCEDCGTPVPRWHDPDRCGCEGQHHNVPCGHIGYRDTCPSWGPVDGCTCEGHPHADRVTDPPGSPTPEAAQ